MMRLVWKSWTTTKKSKSTKQDETSRMHHRQWAEWEWLDQRLSEHFEEQAKSHRADQCQKK